MALLSRSLIGEPLVLSADLLLQYPELAEARYRRGGLPPRIGGWFLGVRSVAGITLWHTVWLAPHADLTPELLLHELAHVRQWRSVRWFPLRYVWESLRRGYSRNRYEIDARTAARDGCGLRRDGASGALHRGLFDASEARAFRLGAPRDHRR